MSPVITDSDFTVLLSQKLPNGSTIYLYPVVRDIDIMLSDEAGGENLAELIENGIKPDFGSLKTIFINSDDIDFTFNADANTIFASHKNQVSASDVEGSEGTVNYGDTIRIPKFSYNANGHIVSSGTTNIVLPSGYQLPKATTNSLGGIIIGSGFDLDENGVLSVKTGSETVAGILKLNSSTSSDSVTEAATPRAVKEVLELAYKKIDDEIKDIDTNGVTPNYNDLAHMFADSSDLDFVIDEENRTFYLTHKNKISASSVSGTNGDVSHGGEIEIPTFEFDSSGHIINIGTSKVTLPGEYILPTASKTVKGGVIIGDTLTVDSSTGEINVVEGSKTQKGIVQLETSIDSDSEDSAATPKSVKDALNTAKKDSTDKVEALKESLLASGIKPTYEGLTPMVASFDDLEVVKNDNEQTIGFRHTNVLEDGGAITSGDTTFINGGTIMLPKFEFDKYGHIISAGTEMVAITAFEGASGIKLVENVIKHTNEIAAGSTASNTEGQLAYGGKFKIPEITYDANGHITSATFKEITLPADVTYTLTKEGKKIILTDSKNGSTFVEVDEFVHPVSGVTPGTYRSFTVDEQGHITAASNPTTLAGYGITDAASKTHQHGDSDITSLSSSKLTGTIPVELIPKAALERLHTVANDTARFALTSATVQNGDSVKVQSGSDGRAHMYYVIDDTKLSTEAGYEEYSAGTASSVPWSGVTDKPNYAGSSSQGGAATKAIGDKNGVDITSYLKSVGISGKTITFTFGDGTTKEITTQDTVYTHPTYTAKASGLYKVTIDGTGHVSAATAVSKSDITALGIPGQDTVYTHPENTAYTSGLYKVTVDELGHVIAATAVSKSDITALGIPGQDTKYTHPSHTSRTSGIYKITVDSSGHVTAATAITKDDITALGIPGTNTTYGNAGTSAGLIMTGGVATISDGKITAISAATKATNDSKDQAITGYIRGLSINGKTITITKGDGTTSTLTTQDTTYTHPAHTAREAGLYKITVNALGHVTGAVAITKDDIVALGIPSTNTTYGNAGTSAGLIMSGGVATISGGQITAISAATKATNDSKDQAITGYVRGLAINGKTITVTFGDGTTKTLTTQDTNTVYTHPTHTAYTSGLYKVTVDDKGHVTATTAVTKDDIVALGIPSTNTTYGNAGTSAGIIKTGGVATISGGQITAISAATKATNDAKDQAITSYIRGLSINGKTITITKGDGTTSTLTTQDTNTTYSNMTAATADAAGKAGLVPAPAAGNQNKFLRGDGTWQTPTNTTYSNMTAATSSAAGKAGLVPAPAAGAQGKFLRGDGTWQTAYTHPSYTAKSSGFYKVTIDATGHVSAVTAVAKSDITALGIPAQDTVYTHPSSSGNKHVPSGGSSGQILRWSADGTATWGSDNDTKNTAGSTNSSSKLFLIGATSQAANPQTYSHDTAYVGTDGHLYSNSSQVVNLGTAQTITAAKTFSGVVSITNTTASTSKSTGALKVSGGAGIAGRMSANEVMVGDKVTMKYNTSTESLDFVFS